MTTRRSRTPGNQLAGIATEGLVPAVIQKGTVVGVNPDAYTMDVRSVFGKRNFRNMPIPSLYAHHYSGEGIHVMPEVGAEVWIAVPSEGDTRPFPLLYQPPVDTLGSMRGARPFMTPGDIFLTTRDGNAVKIRRGGAIEIESTPTCRTIYLPREGRIVNIAEGMSIQTLAGTLDWYVGEPDELPGAARTANIRGRFKGFTNHKFSMVDLDVGQEIGAEGAVSLKVFQSGDVQEEGDRQLLAQVLISNSGVRVRLADRKTFNITGENTNSSEKTMMGRTWLNEMDTILAGISADLTAIKTGIIAGGGAYDPTVLQTKIAALRTKISDSLTNDAGPLLSQYTKTE